MNKKTIGIVVILVAISAGIGYFAKPSKVEVQVKEVVKTVTVKEEAKVKIVYRTKVVRPDGTIEETESSREETNTKEQASTESTKSSSKVTTNDIGLNLGVLAIVDVKDIKGDREYAIVGSKRVLGAVSVNGLVSVNNKSDIKIGAGLGWSF